MHPICIALLHVHIPIALHNLLQKWTPRTHIMRAIVTRMTTTTKKQKQKLSRNIRTDWFPSGKRNHNAVLIY